MKIRNLLPGFALAALLALGIVGPQSAFAQANNFTCDNGPHPVPDGYDGTVDLSQWAQEANQSCVLGAKHVTGSFYVSGFLSVSIGSITADNGDIIVAGAPSSDLTTGDLTAGGFVQVSSVGAIQVGTVTAGTTGTGHILIGAPGNVTAADLLNTGGDITVWSYGNVQVTSTVDNTYGGISIRSQGLIEAPSITNKDGDVRIFANYHQTGGDPLVIGSGGIGYIYNNGDYGYGIYISSPGGINYNGTDLLQTHADSGPPGYVYLDGGSTGTVSLVGSIVVDKSDGAGSIAIFAPEIVTNGATLSASASAGSPAGYVNLITGQITKTGAFTINNNGDGGFTADIHLGITPADSWSVYPDQSDPSFPLVTGPFQASSQPMSITGSGQLTITANGDNHAVQIYGYPPDA